MSGIGRKLVHLYYERFLSAPGELDVADEIMTGDVEFRNPISPDVIRGIEEYRQFALRWYRGFPDRVFSVVDVVEEDDLVAAVFTITGTHDGEFMGRQPSGAHIEVHGMNLFRIVDGRIRDVQAFFDSGTLYDPIGRA
jgi:steroid delta-isomerase-like uncharacterized protein